MDGYDYVEPVEYEEEVTSNPLEDPHRPIADDYQRNLWYLVIMFVIALCSLCLTAWNAYKHRFLSFFGHRKAWLAIVFNPDLKKKQI